MDFNNYDPSSNDKNIGFFLDASFLSELNRNIENIKKTKDAINEIKNLIDVSMFTENYD